jgi:hypothetical protein
MNSLTHVGIMGKRGKDAARVVRGIYERDKCRMNLWSEPAVPSWDVWKKAGWGMEPAEDAHCNDIAGALIELLEDAESGVLISVTRKAEIHTSSDLLRCGGDVGVDFIFKPFEISGLEVFSGKDLAINELAL